ncbi:hypothetical protein BGZ73_006520 [Actinomortierella ambigua]|nr:hypothetical protein BGZ73_006520 [Actinomortierella ambigua]
MLGTIHRAFFGKSLAVELPRKFRAYVDLQLAVPVVFHVAFLCVMGLHPWYHLAAATIGFLSTYHLALLELMPSTPALFIHRKSILQREVARLLGIFLLAEFTARSGVVEQTRAERRCTLLVADCSFAFVLWLGWQLYKHGIDCANTDTSRNKDLKTK